MISPDRKPYALPVKCFPYAGPKEADIRRILNVFVKEMVKQWMKVAGTSENLKNFVCKY